MKVTASGDGRSGAPVSPDEPVPNAGNASSPPSSCDAEPDEQELRDRRLVRRLRAGDERAFQELVTTYQDRIFGLTMRMIGNAHEAEDLAQDVFLTVYRAIDNYRGEGRFSTWLYRIASNACKNRIKYLRGRAAHTRVPIDETPEAHQQDGAPPNPLHTQIAGPEAMTEGARLEAAVQRELAALDPEHRLLIVLRDIEGLSYHEMLTITGLAEGTLKSRLHRARLALKERLKPHLG